MLRLSSVTEIDANTRKSVGQRCLTRLAKPMQSFVRGEPKRSGTLAAIPGDHLKDIERAARERTGCNRCRCP